MAEVSSSTTAEVQHVQRWLAHLESRMSTVVQSENPFVTEASQHVLSAGGKRMRPALVFLTGQFGAVGADEDRLEVAAMVVELTHVASLYHDDVMDDAEMRRGVSSANAHFGNTVAILAGDYIFARASSLVSTLGPAFVARQSDTFSRMVQGQIAEFKGPAVGEDPMEHYLRVLGDKTAALIATSAVFGGMVAGLDDGALAALDRFGQALGIAFQLHDDLIDIMSDTAGKAPGTDLRQGVSTLPLLLLARSDVPSDQELVAAFDAGLDDDAVAGALAALRVHPVIDQAREVIVEYARQAETELAGLPDGRAKSELVALVSDMTSQVRAQ